MTRNSRKFQKQTKPQHSQQDRIPAPPPTSEKPTGNPFGISFVVPTEFVKLPTAGAFYPVSNPLNSVESVEIRNMTAKEEDLLSTADEASGGLIFDRLIDALLVDQNLNSTMFCEEDKMALLLTARISGYGQEYSVMEYCASCEDRTKHNYDLTKQEIEHEPFHDLEYSRGENTYSITLPLSNIKVSMINFSTEDEEALEKEKRQKSKHNLEHNSTLSFLRRVVLSAQGETDKKLLNKLFEVLPAADAQVIKDAHGKAKPRISTMQETKCSECDSATRKEVPFSWAFFRSDV